jgi:hypothetical protein
MTQSTEITFDLGTVLTAFTRDSTQKTIMGRRTKSSIAKTLVSGCPLCSMSCSRVTRTYGVTNAPKMESSWGIFLWYPSSTIVQAMMTRLSLAAVVWEAPIGWTVPSPAIVNSHQPRHVYVTFILLWAILAVSCRREQPCKQSGSSYTYSILAHRPEHRLQPLRQL